MLVSEFSVELATLDEIDGVPAYGKGFWYRPGTDWFQGRNGRPAISRKEAAIQQKLLAKRLKKFIATEPPADVEKLARAFMEALEDCVPNDRCGSLGCPSCARAGQRWFAASVAAKVQASPGKWVATSLIVKNHRFPEGKLDPKTIFEPLREYLTPILKEAGMREAFGAFDISFNEHLEDDFKRHWRPHLYAVGRVKSVDDFKEALKDSLEASRTTPRPCYTRSVKDPLKAGAYAMKYPGVRRQTLPATIKNGETKRRNTHDAPLTWRQSVELALVLDQLDLADRLFLITR